MELRRALLLFAIVLGVAAVVAALASPSSRRSDGGATTAPARTPAAPAAARRPTRVRIGARGAPVRRTLEVGRAATVVVSVDEPGQVEIRSLGLTDAAEPHDPAVFETLPMRERRHEVLFTPAGGVRARVVGVLASQPRE